MTRFDYYMKRDGNLTKAFDDFMYSVDGRFVVSKYNKWLIEEIPTYILDEVEHKYLESFLKPFKSRVMGITKLKDGNTTPFLTIELSNGEPPIFLPYFSNNEMYKGMKLNKTYTYEQLITNNHL